MKVWGKMVAAPRVCSSANETGTDRAWGCVALRVCSCVCCKSHWEILITGLHPPVMPMKNHSFSPCNTLRISECACATQSIKACQQHAANPSPCSALLHVELSCGFSWSPAWWTLRHLCCNAAKAIINYQLWLNARAQRDSSVRTWVQEPEEIWLDTKTDKAENTHGSCGSGHPLIRRLGRNTEPQIAPACCFGVWVRVNEILCEALWIECATTPGEQVGTLHRSLWHQRMNVSV